MIVLNIVNDSGFPESFLYSTEKEFVEGFETALESVTGEKFSFSGNVGVGKDGIVESKSGFYKYFSSWVEVGVPEESCPKNPSYF